MPPGAFADDRGPSTAVFPPQSLPLKFNHKLHVGTQKLKCDTCHAKAVTSNSSADGLLPAATTCDGCHGSNHANLDDVKAGDEGGRQVQYCHLNLLGR